MHPSIRYAPATIAKQATGSSVPATETDLAIITDPRYLEHAQLSLYLKVTLGAATKVSFGYYFSFDNGSTWYKVCIRDLTTNKGELVDIPMYLDSGSPSPSAGVYQTVDNLPSSGANAFKITGVATGAVSGAYSVTVMSRDN